MIKIYYGYDDFEENKEKIKTFCIKSIDLLYKFADENLLQYLLNVSTDRENPGKKVWIVELNTYTQDVINSYYMGSYKNNKRKQRMQKNEQEISC